MSSGKSKLVRLWWLSYCLRERTTKWQVYEQILRVPYYVVFSRYTEQLQVFHLVGGHYEPAELTQGRLLIPELELSLGLWRGSFQSFNRLWLRWMTVEGELIPLPDEEVTEAKQRANTAEQRAEQLAARLREMGVDPDQLD